MQVVRDGLDALHFVASDVEWPAIDQNGKLSNPEGSRTGPEVYAFQQVGYEELKDRHAIVEALQKADAAVLPPLAKTAATARQTAQTRYADVMRKVRGARVVSDVFPKELLETIDAAYRSTVKERIPFMADTTSPLWMDALRGYQSSVRESCKRYWTATLKKLRETAPDSGSIRALENAPQKLEWVFELQRLGLGFALPFPTQTFMADLRTKLAEADNGIATVSSDPADFLCLS